MCVCVCARAGVHGRVCKLVSSNLHNDNSFFNVFLCVAVTSCLSEPCQHGGTCNATIGVDGFTCICAPGWTGDTCEEGRFTEMLLRK